MPRKKVEPNVPETMSVRAYAIRIGVDEKAVRQAINKGIIFDGYDLKLKKIIVEKADIEYGQIKELVKPQRGVSRERANAANEKKETSPQSDSRISKSQKYKLESLAKEIGGPLATIRITPNMKMGEAVRYREIFALAIDKKKLEELERTLVRKDEVNKTLFDFANELKKALFSIPAKVVSHIQSADNELEGINILNDEITHVLSMYAKTEIN